MPVHYPMLSTVAVSTNLCTRVCTSFHNARNE